MMNIVRAPIFLICWVDGVIAWDLGWDRFRKGWSFDDSASKSRHTYQNKGKEPRDFDQKLASLRKDIEELQESKNKLQEKLRRTESEHESEKAKLIKDLKESKRREKDLAFALQDTKDASYARARDLRCGENDCAARVEAEDKLADERMKTISLTEELAASQEMGSNCLDEKAALQVGLANSTRRADGLQDTVHKLANDLRASVIIVKGADLTTEAQTIVNGSLIQPMAPMAGGAAVACFMGLWLLLTLRTDKVVEGKALQQPPAAVDEVGESQNATDDTKAVAASLDSEMQAIEQEQEPAPQATRATPEDDLDEDSDGASSVEAFEIVDAPLQTAEDAAAVARDAASDWY
eukprot:TRINITY_DN28663_c0_g1_i2.p1 TRINITY_DN28663_c0_g1~~TRINITY_DN28663_c0_g1_i2.p1  ORF type:complete len:351 (+),score=91.38 TRINITY_DN28663_c0_g1_i2:65-1117(+)